MRASFPHFQCSRSAFHPCTARLRPLPCTHCDEDMHTRAHVCVRMPPRRSWCQRPMMRPRRVVPRAAAMPVDGDGGGGSSSGGSSGGDARSCPGSVSGHHRAGARHPRRNRRFVCPANSERFAAVLAGVRRLWFLIGRSGRVVDCADWCSYSRARRRHAIKSSADIIGGGACVRACARDRDFAIFCFSRPT